MQEDQVQLKNLRTVSKWWSKCVSNPPTHRVSAGSRSKCRGLLAPSAVLALLIVQACSAGDTKTLSVGELFKHSRETGICSHIFPLVQFLY